MIPDAFIIICLVLSAFLLGCAAILYLRAGKKAEKEYPEKINKFYNRLQWIYKCTYLNFALYSPSGERQLLVSEGERKNSRTEPNDILGNNLFELPFLTEKDMKELKNGGKIEKQIAYRRYAGGRNENRVYHIILKAIPESEVFRYIVLHFDVTNFIDDLEEKQRTEDLINFASSSSKVGVACYDLYSREGFATDVWYDNLSEVRQKKIHPDYSEAEPQQREDILRHLAGMANGSDQPLKTDLLIRKEGEEKWIREFIFVQSRSGAPRELKILDLNIDITSIKEGEKRLTELNVKARKAKEESDEFINSISHEVRTPLNSIVGFSGLLINTGDPGEREEFVRIIRRNNKMITELIDNILSISQIDSGHIEASGSLIPLNAFITSLREETLRQKEADENFKNKNIDIFCDLPEKETYADINRHLLGKIFDNLISNALKFTEQGSVTLGYREHNRKIRFYVRDTGKGVAPENREKIFNRFEKIDTFSQGTGLGLPLCKSIVFRLGGEIGVESEPGKGSTFWFTAGGPDGREKNKFVGI